MRQWGDPRGDLVHVYMHVRHFQRGVGGVSEGRLCYMCTCMCAMKHPNSGAPATRFSAVDSGQKGGGVTAFDLVLQQTLVQADIAGCGLEGVGAHKMPLC